MKEDIERSKSLPRLWEDDLKVLADARDRHHDEEELKDDRFKDDGGDHEGDVKDGRLKSFDVVLAVTCWICHQRWTTSSQQQSQCHESQRAP